MAGSEILFVNLTLLAGLLLWILNCPSRSTPARLVAVLFLQVLAILYVRWRYTETLPPFDWVWSAAWPWVFFGFELVVVGYELWSLGVLVRISDHSPEADRHERESYGYDNLPTVDVFIPTYSEGIDILRATIRAALAMDYPGDRLRIWMLDDSRRTWLSELCAEHGVGYFARPTNEHGKAGNLNYAFPRTFGEYILVIDADFLLERNFIRRTLGFLLENEEIALVQTPQHFMNPDPVQHNLFGDTAWTEEQHFFMTMVESGRDSHRNAFCVGSGWIVKRRCVEELGGFPQETICEDLEISYVLKGRGYRTLFLNEPLAVGLAPESMPEYIKQRVRWCSGTLQHAFIATGPFRAKGLSLLDRLFYIEPIVYWFTFPFMLLLIAAPIIFWHTGVSAIQGMNEGVWSLLIPRFLAGYVLVYWLSERKVMPPITAINKLVVAFHLTAAISKALVRPFGSPFQVTSKGQDRSRVVVQWGLVRMFLVPFLVLLAGVAMNLSGYHQVVPINDMTVLDVAWSCLTLLLLALCMLACVEQPKGAGYLNAASEVRHAHVGRTAAAVFRRLFA